MLFEGKSHSHPLSLLFLTMHNRFVDRYIPGYVFFLGDLTQDPRWKGRSLVLTLDNNREVIAVSQ